MAAKRKKPLSFEAGMQELDDLVEKLSSSELPLEEAIALYEQGTQLYAQLEALLAQQKKRIEMIDPDTAEIEAFEGNEP
ncbi:MAG: exodeoxyribonuclease VII small subunit [Clostridiales bacterium]|nr:exodeoxyribonuclease VII small subunit [Clostridiales bacterium]